MGFEVFEKRKGGRLIEGPTVTHLSCGDFSMSGDAYALLGLPDKLYVMYDPETNRIGFRAASRSDGGAYWVRKTSGYVGVAGRAMCRHHDIPYGNATRYPAVLEDGVLVVDLSGDSVRVGRSGHPIRERGGR